MTDTHGLATAPSTLHEAQRRRRGVQAALDRLERAVAAPSTDREAEWVVRMADELTHLQGTWDNHVTVTEQADGLFDEVMAEAPRLAHQIDYLRTDHLRIATLIEGARQLTGRPAAEGFVSEISETAVDLLSRLTRHRQRGATLVYEAYHVDIDAAD